MQAIDQKPELLAIRHSGRLWISLGVGPSGCHIWPIDEYFARQRHKPTVEARIRRFHPNGREEASRLRGWWHKPMSWRRAKKKMARGDKVYSFRLRGGKRIWNWAYMGPYEDI